jgi:hypothetical protein
MSTSCGEGRHVSEDAYEKRWRKGRKVIGRDIVVHVDDAAEAERERFVCVGYWGGASGGGVICESQITGHRHHMRVEDLTVVGRAEVVPLPPPEPVPMPTRDALLAKDDAELAALVLMAMRAGATRANYIALGRLLREALEDEHGEELWRGVARRRR